MQSFLSLVNQNLGFHPENLIATRMELPNASPAEKREFFHAALDRLSALPGVVSAGISSGLPPFGGGESDIDVPGRSHTEPWHAQFELCDDRYFQTVGFRLVSGSGFAPGDVAAGRKAAVINETLRKQYFGNDDPLGKQIRLGLLATVRGGVADPTFVIVGVVQDARNRGLEQPVSPAAFIPYTVTGLGFPRILIRTSGDAHLFVNTLRREMRAVNGNIVQRDPMILEEMLADRSYARPRFSVLLMAVFGTLGLLLVATGVYGVMAYVVSRQTREIGIRMALGAQRSQVFRAVFTGAFRLIGLGALLGGIASVATNRIIANQIWAVRMFDPVALGGAVALIAVLGGVACFQPAFRATRVDPSVALRQE